MSNKYNEVGDSGEIQKALLTDTEDGRRPIDIEPLTIKPTEAIGVGGTAIWSGYIQELEKDKDLSGRTKYKTYSDLLANVATIATGVRFFLNLVSKAAWKVEPAEDGGAKADELADLVDDFIHDMETPWHRVVRRASMFKYYGFSVQECTYKKRDDGTIGLLDIEPRPQITIERWDVDRNSRVLGAIQRDPQTQHDIYLPREKIIYLVDDSLSDSPEGLGLFRHLVDAAKRLRRYLQLEGFGFENDLRGIPIAKAPLTDLDQLVKNGKITQAKASELLEGMTLFLRNHIKSPELAMMIDSKPYLNADGSPSSVAQWEIDTLQAASPALADAGAAITRIMLEIARLLGIEHLMMGDGKAGSFALAKVKANNFALIVDNTLKELSEQFEKDILNPLWDLNGWDPELKPSFKVESIAQQDVEMMANVLQSMAGAGVMLDRDDEAVKELFDLLGLSRLEEMEDPGLQLDGDTSSPPVNQPPDPANTEEGDELESPEDRADEAEEEGV